MNLHERVAEALGWTVSEVQSLSLSSLREMVRPVSPKLAHELTLATQNPQSLVKPRKVRRP
jgi:hypothetical protein